MRGARLRARHKADGRDLHAEASRAGAEDFFQALVAAVAVIAHADGRLDLAERRKLVEAFLASPAMAGFSVADLAEELAHHARAYGYAPDLAERQALATLNISALGTADRLSIRNACHQVITADGLVHPVELGALHRVERALGLEEATDE
ncbi:TerB family tellurite resistance protein [Devosia beringensis]|uniref:TerB family tellurite resistance protein n=1 Tax=Devosia beringensis TaxID=2657486 RepID=UPI00186B8156|nr:TerB family tellurite resistance protein [Devosia beringensis]